MTALYSSVYISTETFQPFSLDKKIEAKKSLYLLKINFT